jgi:hypothetical protein
MNKTCPQCWHETNYERDICPTCSFNYATGRGGKWPATCPDDWEFFPTPTEATLALLAREKFDGLTWEPCAGTGSIARFFPGPIIASDIGADFYGFGEKVDFLDRGQVRPFLQGREVANIITNPPHRATSWTVFKRQALRFAPKVAFLLPARHLGNELETAHPPKRVYVFWNKVNFLNASVGWKYAWFVWERGWKRFPESITPIK